MLSAWRCTPVSLNCGHALRSTTVRPRTFPSNIRPTAAGIPVRPISSVVRASLLRSRSRASRDHAWSRISCGALTESDLSTARARCSRSAAGCHISEARSSRCRAYAWLASCRRMSPNMAREDCPVALLWPRYSTTAARAGRPAYHARSAASCEALVRKVTGLCPGARALLSGVSTYFARVSHWSLPFAGFESQHFAFCRCNADAERHEFLAAKTPPHSCGALLCSRSASSELRAARH